MAWTVVTPPGSGWTPTPAGVTYQDATLLATDDLTVLLVDELGEGLLAGDLVPGDAWLRPDGPAGPWTRVV